ncbi:hypothetical protein Tco_1371220 [Tanacetum coccineum]
MTTTLDTTLALSIPPQSIVQTTPKLEAFTTPLAPRALTFSNQPKTPLEPHPYLPSTNELPPRPINPLLQHTLSQTLPQTTLLTKKEPMNADMQSMKDNQVWDLVDLPPNTKIAGSKWLFKKKTDMDGKAYTYKARVVDWKIAKQSITTKSSTEAEYMAASEAAKEAVWIKKFIYGLDVVPTNKEPIEMYCDNSGAIIIANEPGITKGAKHYRTKVHYLREVIELGDIRLVKVHTYDNVVDPFTKTLPLNKHSSHTKTIGLFPTSSLMQICYLVFRY